MNTFSKGLTRDGRTSPDDPGRNDGQEKLGKTLCYLIVPYFPPQDRFFKGYLIVNFLLIPKEIPPY